MIISIGFIPQSNDNQKAGVQNADINLHVVNGTKGRKPYFVMQAGTWIPAEEENAAYFKPAGFNIQANLGTTEIPEFSEQVQFDPTELPIALKGTNPSDQLISQLDQYSKSLLEATYPNVEFSIN